MLKRVKIQGYKSLADVEVHLQPLCVLFGPNASGKSNFLDALQLLSRIVTSDNLRHAFAPPYRGSVLESFTFGPGGIGSVRTKEKVSFAIEVDVELSPAVIDTVNRRILEVEEPRSSEYIYEKYLRYHIIVESLPNSGILRVTSESLVPLNANSEPDAQRAFLQWNMNEQQLQIEGRRPSHPENLDHSILSIPLYPGQSPHLMAIREELVNWLFFYLEPRERMRMPTPVKEVHRIGPMGEDIAAFLNTLYALDAVQFKAVVNALHMVVPSITDIKVDMDKRGDVELTLMEGQKPISSRLISDGTLRVLGLLALGSSREERPTLIGLEEPENGIHPRRLRLIASLLQTRARHDNQMIVTTHSPLLADLIPHEFLYVCRIRKGRTFIDPFSTWELADDKSLDDEDEQDLTVSERILRGDFDA